MPYGNLEVPLYIKSEQFGESIDINLENYIENDYQKQISKTTIDENTLIILNKLNNSSKKILQLLINNNPKNKIFNIGITNEKYRNEIKNTFNQSNINVLIINNEVEHFGTVDKYDVKLSPYFKKFTNNILISEIGFDPLFGFSGGATNILKMFKDLSKQAFLIREDNIPKPWLDNNINRFAEQIGELLDNFSNIGIFEHESSIKKIFTGTLNQTHKAAKEFLSEIGNKTIEYSINNIILSPGNNQDKTLSSSLNSLFNILHGIEVNSKIILVAQCEDGLGSRAWDLYATGRLNIQKLIKNNNYVEGLENIIYFEEIKKNNRISIVSTLPNYYIKNILKVDSRKTVTEAVNSFVNSQKKTYLLKNSNHIIIKKSV